MKSAIRSTSRKIWMLIVSGNTFGVNRNPLFGFFYRLSSAHKSNPDSVGMSLEWIKRQRTIARQPRFGVHMLLTACKPKLRLREVFAGEFGYLYLWRLITHPNHPR